MQEIREIKLRRPDDMHVHLRQGQELAGYTEDLASSFARALVMPNTIPPITTPEELVRYRAAILQAAAPGGRGLGLTPLMTFKIQPGMDRERVRALKAAGAIAGKYYPQGVTTNSEDGIAESETVMETIAAMEAEGLVLCLHGEEPGAEALDRERAFLPRLIQFAEGFPNLRIVLEHVSSASGVEAVRALPDRVAATVTVHHLLYTLDDLLGGGLDPHLFCKPVVKSARDREAIQRVVLDANARFFFGSDSAPHPRSAKEGGRGAAGVYSMPVSLPLLAAFFDERGCLELLEPFVSRFGAEFYGLPPNEGTIVLRREAWGVPEVIHGVVPLAAGRELAWRVALPH